MPDRTVGEILDGLGVTASLGPDDLVSGAVVILKVVPPDGSPILRFVSDDGSDWITEYAMVGNAWDMVRGIVRGADDDE